MADETKPRHKNARNDLTAEYVRSVLSYDSETGIFRWKLTDRNHFSGQKACITPTKGYHRIGLRGYKRQAHRLAWLIMTGEWPEFEVDHKDEDGTNNKWDNLRPATSGQNMSHKGKRKDNTTGYKGVYFNKNAKKFQAHIRSKATGLVYLGLFDTAEEGHKAYREAAKTIHGEFAHD